MKTQAKLIFLAAAIVVSASTIIPTTSVIAQGVTVRNDRHPMVEGSGRIVRQDRAVAAFRRIETLGAATVHVRLGAERSLAIAADDNVLPLLTSDVRNGTLTIGSRGSYRIRGPIKVWITAPDIEAYRTAGSGNVMIEGVDNDRLGLTVQGSGKVRAVGRTRHLDLAIHGSGDADLAGLSAVNVEAGLYGSGRATVRASGQLGARVIGSGDLRYIGRPAGLREQRIGSGRISAVAR